MWELDHKESWAPKNWRFWTVVLEKTLESPLDCKEIQPVNPKGNQFWMFIGRTDTEAETPMLWPPDAKNWLTGKRLWCWERLKAGGEGMTEDEMVGWHHRLDGHEFEQVPRVGDGQGGLGAAVHGVAKSRTRLSDWTELLFPSDYMVFITKISATATRCYSTSQKQREVCGRRHLDGTVSRRDTGWLKLPVEIPQIITRWQHWDKHTAEVRVSRPKAA